MNIKQPCFNVGVPVDLPPLTRDQMSDLIQRYGLPWSEAEVDTLMGMVGGHPFLARMALQQIARGEITLAQFIEIAPTQEWLFANHLNRHLGNLEERHLAKAMGQVVTADGPVRLPVSEGSKLEYMGLVRFQGNDVVPLCGLYRQYFQAVLRG